jgi:hypothetical protein
MRQNKGIPHRTGYGPRSPARTATASERALILDEREKEKGRLGGGLFDDALEFDQRE